MVTGLAVDNAGDWRLAALKSTKGRLIFKLLRDEFNGPHGQRLRDLIIHNARLVKSLPLDVAESLLDHVKTEAIKGRRADDIMQDIKDRVPDIVDSKARLLARTEISKTSTAITRARSESIGLDWYVWRTSKDSRVRHSHEIMDGVLVKWTDPPSPERLASEPRTYGNYHAGEIFNCRCYPEPVIRLDTLTWPMKVYTGGRIVRMNRAQFEKLTA
jgi:SPP1 gp7 family putative phage head morphogenesis protein